MPSHLASSYGVHVLTGMHSANDWEQQARDESGGFGVGAGVVGRLSDGNCDGDSEGITDGTCDGGSEGPSDGNFDGDSVGLPDGPCDGGSEGISDGSSEGM